MTREIIIPQSYVRVIKVRKNVKKSVARNSTTVKNSVAVKGSTKDVTFGGTASLALKGTKKQAVEKAFSDASNRLPKKLLQLAVGIIYVILYAILSVFTAFDFVWDCIWEKCGQLTRKIGTEGLFGEANDGYYHTEDGFRLRASAITVRQSREKR